VKPRKTPWAAEALLDLGGFGSGGVSRANSPLPVDRGDMNDAGAVALGGEMTAQRIPPTNAGLGSSFTENMASYSGNTSSGYPSSSAMTIPASTSTDPFALSPIPLTTSTLLEQRRWADLDYQWDRQAHYTMPNVDPDGYAPSGSHVVGDDFSRFLEQAGITVTDDTDPFTWNSRAE